MSDTTKTAEPKDSTELARYAINYVLERIRDDENVRYHMGGFTGAFEALKAAHSALTGISGECIERDVLGRALRRTAHGQTIDAIKDILALRQSREISEQDALSKIASLVGFQL